MSLFSLRSPGVPILLASVLLVSFSTRQAGAQQQVGNYASYAASGRGIVVTGATGETIRITPYGDYIVRVQVAKNGESFYADTRYEMVASHDWPGALDLVDSASALVASTMARRPVHSLPLKPVSRPMDCGRSFSSSQR